MSLSTSVSGPAAQHFVQPTGDDWTAWKAWAQASAGTPALGLEVREIADGLAVADIRDSITPLNPNGAVHGGLVAAIIDQIGSLATVTRVPAGHGLATCTLNVEYLRPAKLPLVAVGRVVRSSRSVIFTHIEVRSGGDVAASASGTWLPKPYPTGGVA